MPQFDSREDLNHRIRGLLRQNRAWWERYGPEALAAGHPASEAADTWLAGVRRVLIPNNWQISRLIERNSHLLNARELEVGERFRLHAELFANRHLAGEHDPTAPRFPEGMNEIFGMPENDA